MSETPANYKVNGVIQFRKKDSDLRTFTPSPEYRSKREEPKLGDSGDCSAADPTANGEADSDPI